MIIRPHPISNPWFRSAAGFVFFVTLSLLFVWGAVNGEGYASHFNAYNFLVSPLISVLLLVKGASYTPPIRLKYFAIIIGTFVFFPIYILTITPVFIILALPWISGWGAGFIMASYSSVALFWCVFKLRRIAYVLGRVNYFSKETKVMPNGDLFLNGNSATDIDIIKKKFFKEHVHDFRWLIPLFIFLTSASYPLQRILTQHGGAKSVFAFCSVFSAPISIYVLGEIFSGFFIWIFLVNKFESKNGVRIFLQ